MKLTTPTGQRWYPSQGYLWWIGVTLALITAGVLCVDVTAVYVIGVWTGLVEQDGQFRLIAQWSTTLLVPLLQLAAGAIGLLSSLTPGQHIVGANTFTALARGVTSVPQVRRCAAVYALLMLSLIEEVHAVGGPVAATAVIVGTAVIGTAVMVDVDRRWWKILWRSAAAPMYPADAVAGARDEMTKDVFDRLGRQWERPEAVSDLGRVHLYIEKARRTASVYRYTGQLLFVVGGGFVATTLIWYFGGRAPLNGWSALVTMLPIAVAMSGFHLIQRAELYAEALAAYMARVEAL
ncbi:hypothetical protein [Tsukamurella paurometabola]|uniref:Uncharacterized protein n=1 Tax=Tsukamurella paurometabola TaxID=2061 RepID=A0ABS5NG42_TSUPA|nr:hypothetical protein [Tsukamurella paurometabola]MBS4103000.1 hypothetical protein [Tsukamurella paurometabola]